MGDDFPQCSKETKQKTDKTKNSELKSIAPDVTNPSDIENKVIEIEVIVGNGPDDASSVDCSAPSICTDGEIICELIDDDHLTHKQDAEHSVNLDIDVQCKIDLGKLNITFTIRSQKILSLEHFSQ